MIVKELIKQLNEIANKDAEVFIYDNCGGSYPMKHVDVYFTEGPHSIGTSFEDPIVEFIELS